VVTPVREGGEAADARRSNARKGAGAGVPVSALLDEGSYASISEMAAGERIERGYLGSLLRLTLLPPDVVEAILDGRQPAKLGLPRVLERVPAEWSEQRQALLDADIAD
jgi:hypothetical protein